MTLRTELQAIYAEYKQLTPQLVVNAARPADHPLHSRFEWDDAVAGEAWRREQAAELIRRVRIVYKTNPNTGERSSVRAYVSTAEPSTAGEYLPTDEAMADPITKKLVLRAFERALFALHRQYSHLKEYEALVRKHMLGESEAA